MKTRHLLLLAAMLLACGAYASQPFRAIIHATESLTPTSKPGVFTLEINGIGKARHLGNLTFSAVETIDFASHPGIAIVTNGEFAITASNGDQIFAVYSGMGEPDPNHAGFFLGTATATLTGGTGRFQCASGIIPFSLVIDAAALTEVITFDGEANLVGHCCE